MRIIKMEKMNDAPAAAGPLANVVLDLEDILSRLQAKEYRAAEQLLRVVIRILK